MKDGKLITCIIPARNEGQSIDRVLLGLPAWVDEILVVDNHSEDDTARAAFEHGAEIVGQGKVGYGVAALSGISVLRTCDIVVFLDGDFSDDPKELDRLVDPILRDEADMVTGSRFLAKPAAGATDAGADAGSNRDGGGVVPSRTRLQAHIAALLMRTLFGVRCSDVCRYRAIRRTVLDRFKFTEFGFGFPAQMQIQAKRVGLRSLEAPVSWRPRFIDSPEEAAMLPPRVPVALWRDVVLPIFRERFRQKPGPPLPPPKWKLMVFAPEPRPGESKPALIEDLGAQAAADLQEKMTRFAIWQAEPLREKRLAAVEVRHETFHEEDARSWYGGDRWAFEQQGPGTLAERLERAFRDAFAGGFETVGAVIADCPAFDTGQMRHAFEAMQNKDVAIGPTTAGRVYWIGLRGMRAEVLEGLGEETTADALVARCEMLGLKLETLDTLVSIENPPDLPVWEQADRKAKGPAGAAGAQKSVKAPDDDKFDSPKRLLRF